MRWLHRDGVALCYEEETRFDLTRAVYIVADELYPRADTRFHELCTNLLYGQTVGSGYFCELEMPG